MIDRRNPKYKEYNWKFMELNENHNRFQYLDGLNINDIPGIGDKMIFSSGNYIFNNFDENYVFIRRVQIPTGARVTCSEMYDHVYESDKIFLEKRLDLRNPDTWEILWDNFVDIMTFKEKILYILSKNGWLKPLMWFIDKMRDIQENESSVLVEVLKGAISNNNVDVVEYILKEYPENIQDLGSNSSIISSIAELAIKPNKQSDYCFPTMKSLIDHGLFESVNTDIVLSPTVIMFKSMNHNETYKLTQSYIDKKDR